MAKVIPGRFTAQADEAFVVFIIGIRVNKFFAFRRWIPAAMEMGPMLRTLFKHPEKGMLGAQTFFYWRGIALVQYWRSFEDLEKFARDKSDCPPLCDLNSRPRCALPWLRLNACRCRVPSLFHVLVRPSHA